MRDSGISATPASIEAAGRPGSDGARHVDPAGGRRARPVDGAGQLRATGADETGQADDLAGPEGQRRVLDTGRGEALDGEGDGRVRGGIRLSG